MVESKPATPLATCDNSLAPSEVDTSLNTTQETNDTVKGDDTLGNTLPTATNTIKSKSIHVHGTDKSSVHPALRGSSPLAVQSMYPVNKPPSDSPTELETFIDSLVPPRNHYTKDGTVIFTDLYFPPPLLPSVINKESSFASSESLNSTASEDEAKRKATEKMARRSPHLSPLHSTSQRLPAKKKPHSPVKSAKRDGGRSSVTPPKSPSKVKKKDSIVAVSKSRSQMSPEKMLRKEKLLQPKRQVHCWLGM